MVEKDYNKKYRKWQAGDTFACKIKNPKEYNGRYLIFIKCEIEGWESPNNVIPFRIKITKDDNLPKTKEELEKLEYIKVLLEAYRDRFLPFDGRIPNEELIKERSKVKFYPDKYGRLTVYIAALLIERKLIKELEQFEYLGNFKIKPPKKEYIPFCEANCWWILLSDLDRFVKFYEELNLKKGLEYDKEFLKTCDFWETYIPPNPKILGELYEEIYGDEEELGDTETYVGGEDEDPYEK